MLDFATTSLAPVWGFAVYILLARANNSGTLTEGIAFAALSIFELLNAPMGTLINGFEEIQTVLNSFRRVQEYLTSEEREDYRIIPDSETAYSSPGLSRQQSNDELPLLDSPSLTLVDSEYVAIVKDASASYSPERGSILKSLTFQIPKGQTTMIYGPVGSGKSTLLRLLLGEMPFTSGSVGTRFSRAAYCPQSPWCIWGTVQNNIVGMSEWDKTWYDTIVSACALSADFAELPNGDQTNVGTRGSRLSGGQQMRVVSTQLSQSF